MAKRRRYWRGGNHLDDLKNRAGDCLREVTGGRADSPHARNTGATKQLDRPLRVRQQQSFGFAHACRMPPRFRGTTPNNTPGRTPKPAWKLSRSQRARLVAAWGRG